MRWSSEFTTKGQTLLVTHGHLAMFMVTRHRDSGQWPADSGQWVWSVGGASARRLVNFSAQVSQSG